MQTPPFLLAILAAHADAYGLRISEFYHRPRDLPGMGWREVWRIKCLAIKAMRDAKASLPQIARVMGYNHHQPVLHALAWLRKQEGTI
jgi:hypothetical protein